MKAKRNFQNLANFCFKVHAYVHVYELGCSLRSRQITTCFYLGTRVLRHSAEGNGHSGTYGMLFNTGIEQVTELLSHQDSREMLSTAQEM